MSSDKEQGPPVARPELVAMGALFAVYLAIVVGGLAIFIVIAVSQS
jgi:hypothetical protein